MARKSMFAELIEMAEAAEEYGPGGAPDLEQPPVEIRTRQPERTTGLEKPTAAILPIYLREMGATPLIDEHQEVELARELQEAREGLAKLALRLPATLQAVRASRVTSTVRSAAASGRSTTSRRSTASSLRYDREHPTGRPRRRAPGHRAGVQAARRPRARRADPGEPAPGRAHREEVPEPRHLLHGPDPGRQHRPDEGRREVRVRARQQVLDLRLLVDQAGDRARDRRQGARSSASRSTSTRRSRRSLASRASWPRRSAASRRRRRSRKKLRMPVVKVEEILGRRPGAAGARGPLGGRR